MRPQPIIAGGIDGWSPKWFSTPTIYHVFVVINAPGLMTQA